ncbi:MAG: glycosyltransferase family 4 protein [Acidiferrobacter sp.]
MRVTLIRQRYRPDGGAERFVADTIEALTARGVAVSLISRDWPQGSANIDHIVCNPPFLGGLWRDIGFAFCVCRRLRLMQADIVQSQELIPCCELYRADGGVHREWLHQRARVQGPFRRWQRWFNLRHYYTLAAERRLFTSPRLKAVICISHMVRADILRHFPINADKLFVLYNGIDCSRFHPQLKDQRSALRARYGIPEEMVVFLFVGSGFLRKGLVTALHAVSRLPAHVGLLVVGRDKRADHYTTLAKKLGVGHRVWLVGPQADSRPFYGAADGLVLPALYEPGGNVILEALACGLPVVASTNCGNAELIQEGKTGFVRDAVDIDSWVEAMRALLDGPRRAEMQGPARDASLDYDLKYLGERYQALYERVLRAGAP